MTQPRPLTDIARDIIENEVLPVLQLAATRMDEANRFERQALLSGNEELIELAHEMNDCALEESHTLNEQAMRRLRDIPGIFRGPDERLTCALRAA